MGMFSMNVNDDAAGTLIFKHPIRNKIFMIDILNNG